jgi:hypothetical protein
VPFKLGTLLVEGWPDLHGRKELLKVQVLRLPGEGLGDPAKERGAQGGSTPFVHQPGANPLLPGQARFKNVALLAQARFKGAKRLLMKLIENP